MGKGSKQRPKSVSEDEFGSSYDRIFSLRGEDDGVTVAASDSEHGRTMYEAIVWIGSCDSWSEAGHKTPRSAFDSAQAQIDSGAFEGLGDLVIEVTDGNGNRVEV